MKTISILLIDDENIILKSLDRALKMEGYSVTTADNGEKAIAYLKKDTFDLVVTDLNMEGVDGIQVLKQTKKIDPEIPVIILTGYGDMTSAIDALRLGADDYMLKPCDLNELYFRMSRCFEKKDLLARLKEQNQKLQDEISAREKVEEELRATSEKIKLFAYSVSHDLKNPAIGIHRLTKFLHRKYSESFDDKGKQFCDLIVKTSRQIEDLVEQINVFISTKEAPLSIERVQLEQILQTVKEEFAPHLHMRRIRWSVPEYMPEIKADRLSIIRVLRNLVDNALKYGGEGLSEIEIGYKESPEFHTLIVKDNGVGLDKQDSSNIFGTFQRNITSSGIEGTGLGLAIVKEIAEHHGGDVGVESSQNKGASFSISISKELPLSCET